MSASRNARQTRWVARQTKDPARKAHLLKLAAKHEANFQALQLEAQAQGHKVAWQWKNLKYPPWEKGTVELSPIPEPPDWFFERMA